MCNKCKGYYLSSIQTCNVSVRECKKCKDPVIISISINFFFIYEVNSNFFINVCKLYAGCMQVVCRFTKPIPVRLYASYTLFFLLTILL